MSIELETICDGCVHAAYVDGKFRLDGKDHFVGCKKQLETSVNLQEGTCESRVEKEQEKPKAE